MEINYANKKNLIAKFVKHNGSVQLDRVRIRVAHYQTVQIKRVMEPE